MLLEVGDGLLEWTVPSHHADFNNLEIDLKRYSKVRELACVIDEFVRGWWLAIHVETTPNHHASSNQDIGPWCNTTPHKEKARLLKIRNNLL